MSTPSTPTADQLAAARASHWRQNADPILTINMLRDWLNTSGLVLYTPRVAQLPAPAEFLDDAVVRDGLTDECVSLRHSALILGCDLRQVNESER